MPAKFDILTEYQVSINRASLETTVRELQRKLANVDAKVRVKLDDTGVGVAKVKERIKEVEDQVNSSTSAITRLGEQIGGYFSRFAAFTLAATTIFKIVRTLGDAKDEAIEFDTTLVRVGQTLGKTRGELNDLRKEVFSLSRELGVASKGLIEASLVIAQAGFTDTEGISKLLGVLAKTQLAPSFKNTANTIQGIIALMHQFRLPADVMEEKFGSINAVAKAFTVEAEDVVTALRVAGGVFAAAGGNMEEFIGIFTAVKDTTQESASTIAHAIKTITARLQRPAAINFFESLGIGGIRDAEGKFVGVFNALKAISEQSKKFDTRSIEFAQIVEQLGGIRQFGKVIPALLEFAKAENAVQIAIGGTNSLFKDQVLAQDALSVSITKANEAWNELLNNFAQNEEMRELAKLLLNLAGIGARLVNEFQKLAPFLTILGTISGLKLGSIIGTGVIKHFKNPSRRSQGGLVKDGETSSLLMGGEYVLDPVVVKRIGLGELNKLNQGRFSEIAKFAKGGPVRGGSGVKDDVPALLTKGEYVLTKDITRKVGRKNLDDLNSGRIGLSDISIFKPKVKPVTQDNVVVQRFARGGSVIRTEIARNTINKLSGQLGIEPPEVLPLIDSPRILGKFRGTLPGKSQILINPFPLNKTKKVSEVAKHELLHYIDFLKGSTGFGSAVPGTVFNELGTELSNYIQELSTSSLPEDARKFLGNFTSRHEALASSFEGLSDRFFVKNVEQPNLKLLRRSLFSTLRKEVPELPRSLRPKFADGGVVTARNKIDKLTGLLGIPPVKVDKQNILPSLRPGRYLPTKNKILVADKINSTLAEQIAKHELLHHIDHLRGSGIESSSIGGTQFNRVGKKLSKFVLKLSNNLPPYEKEFLLRQATLRESLARSFDKLSDEQFVENIKKPNISLLRKSLFDSLKQQIPKISDSLRPKFATGGIVPNLKNLEEFLGPSLKLPIRSIKDDPNTFELLQNNIVTPDELVGNTVLNKLGKTLPRLNKVKLRLGREEVNNLRALMGDLGEFDPEQLQISAIAGPRGLKNILQHEIIHAADFDPKTKKFLSNVGGTQFNKVGKRLSKYILRLKNRVDPNSNFIRDAAYIGKPSESLSYAMESLPLPILQKNLVKPDFKLLRRSLHDTLEKEYAGIPKFIPDRFASGGLVGRKLFRKKSFDISKPYNVGQFQFDPKEGIGAVPYSPNINFLGAGILMKPRDFLGLNPERTFSFDKVRELIKSGAKIGPPFLKLLKEGENLRVIAHEGRGRMSVLNELAPDLEIPVHSLITEGDNRFNKLITSAKLTPDILFRNILNDIQMPDDLHKNFSFKPRKVIHGGNLLKRGFASGGLVKSRNIKLDLGGKYKVKNFEFDAIEGFGAKDISRDINDVGFGLMMKPREFLSLNPPRLLKSFPVDEIRKLIKSGVPIGPPFLRLFDEKGKLPRVTGHEGRGRMTILNELAPETDFPVHVLQYGKLGKDKIDYNIDELFSRILSDTHAKTQNFFDPKKVIYKGQFLRKKFAIGGPVPGSGNTDNVPALLTPGEYVLKKSVVNRIGKDRLDRVNFKGEKFAHGGFVKLATGGDPGDFKLQPLDPNIGKFISDNLSDKIKKAIEKATKEIRVKLPPETFESSLLGKDVKLKPPVKRPEPTLTTGEVPVTKPFVNPFTQIGPGLSKLSGGALNAAAEKLLRVAEEARQQARLEGSQKLNVGDVEIGQRDLVQLAIPLSLRKKPLTEEAHAKARADKAEAERLALFPAARTPLASLPIDRELRPAVAVLERAGDAITHTFTPREPSGGVVPSLAKFVEPTFAGNTKIHELAALGSARGLGAFGPDTVKDAVNRGLGSFVPHVPIIPDKVQLPLQDPVTLRRKSPINTELRSLTGLGEKLISSDQDLQEALRQIDPSIVGKVVTGIERGNTNLGGRQRRGIVNLNTGKITIGKQGTDKTVAHEVGHLVDQSLGGGLGSKKLASSIPGTLQNVIAKRLLPKVKAQLEAAGVAPDIIKEKTKLREIFADFFAQQTNEIRRVLSGTTSLSEGKRQIRALNQPKELIDPRDTVIPISRSPASFNPDVVIGGFGRPGDVERKNLRALEPIRGSDAGFKLAKEEQRARSLLAKQKFKEITASARTISAKDAEAQATKLVTRDFLIANKDKIRGLAEAESTKLQGTGISPASANILGRQQATQKLLQEEAETIQRGIRTKTKEILTANQGISNRQAYNIATARATREILNRPPSGPPTKPPSFIGRLKDKATGLFGQPKTEQQAIARQKVGRGVEGAALLGLIFSQNDTATQAFKGAFGEKGGVAQAAVGGALTGGLAGATFGPVGAAVGALIGGITSATFAFSQLAEDLRQTRIQQSLLFLDGQVRDIDFKKINEPLDQTKLIFDDVLKGARGPLKDAFSDLTNDQIKNLTVGEINKRAPRVFSGSGVEFEKFKLATDINARPNFVSPISAATQKDFDTIRAQRIQEVAPVANTVSKLFEQLAGTGRFSKIEEIEKLIPGFIDIIAVSRDGYVKNADALRKEFQTRLQTIDKIVDANAAFDSLNQPIARLVNAQSSISRFFSELGPTTSRASQPQEFITKASLQDLGTNRFTKDLNKLPVDSEVRGTVNELNRVIAELPQRIEESQRLGRRLGVDPKDFISGITSDNSIATAISKTLANTGDFGDIVKDPTKLIDELIRDFKPLLEEVDKTINGVKKFQQELLSNTQSFLELRTSVNDLQLAQESSVLDITRLKREFSGQTPVAGADRQIFERDIFRRTGSTSVEGVTKLIQDLENRFKTTGDPRLIQASNAATEALKRFADVTNRTRDIQERLNALESSRVSKRGLVEGFITSGGDERRKNIFQIARARAFVGAGLDPRKTSLKELAQILPGLRKLGGAIVPGTDKTGNRLADELLDKLGGFPENKEIEGLQADIIKAHEESAIASKFLAERQSLIFDDFLNKLPQIHNDFLTRLERIFNLPRDPAGPPRQTIIPPGPLPTKFKPIDDLPKPSFGPSLRRGNLPLKATPENPELLFEGSGIFKDEIFSKPPLKEFVFGAGKEVIDKALDQPESRLQRKTSIGPNLRKDNIGEGLSNKGPELYFEGSGLFQKDLDKLFKKGFAFGGMVPGRGRGDIVPAMLEPGEFVMRRNAVKNIGLHKLQQMNALAFGGEQEKDIIDLVGGKKGGVVRTNAIGFQQGGLVPNVNLENFNTNFGVNIQKLADAISAIPHTITLEAKHTIEVIHNGAQIFQNMEPSIVTMVEKTVEDALNKMLREKFNEAGRFNLTRKK